MFEVENTISTWVYNLFEYEYLLDKLMEFSKPINF